MRLSITSIYKLQKIIYNKEKKYMKELIKSFLLCHSLFLYYEIFFNK